MFDAQRDAVFSAMKRLCYVDVELVVAETVCNVTAGVRSTSRPTTLTPSESPELSSSPKKCCVPKMNASETALQANIDCALNAQSRALPM
ncbi:hypothetical protein JHK87_019390 [Glycine soja]|nr:hypothetical protein JHK87_019390 [Glycine soja]